MTETDKDARIKELEAQVASLQAQLRSARQTIEQYQRHDRRSYWDQQDYLPYDEDRDR